jgi:hypothetical protein
MTTNPSEIHVAARGWLHPSWQEDFYPDGLPEDWRLSYYSNEFRAVVVPAAEWTGLETVEIERWTEDVSQTFLFYLEVEDLVADWGQIAKRIKPLGEYLGGFILRPLETDDDLSMLSANIAAASQLAQVSVLLPDGVKPSPSGRKLLNQYGVQCVWNVGDGSPDWVSETYDPKFVVVRVVGNNTFTARQWRETIEIAMQKGIRETNTRGYEGNQVILLVFDNEKPNLNDLRTATMIGELMEMPGAIQQE